MSLIAVAQVAAIHRVVEVGSALVAVIAAAVDVIEKKPYANALTRIHRELSLEMVLAVGSVAAVVVADVGERRQRVGEEEVLHRCYEIVVGIDEDEFIILFPVNEDTVLTWRPQVAGGVVFPPQARCEDGVLKHIGERIGLSGDTVAESAVNLPHVDAFGNLLVGTQRVGRLLPVLGIGDIAVGVYLVEPVVVIVNLRMR